MDAQLIVSLHKTNNLPDSSISLLSPAKLNLYLNIVGKYHSGFHKIESIVERVSLYDEVTISVERKPMIRITCNDKGLENEDNLCFKAAQLLKEKFSLPFGLCIALKKHIPIGAGLGGGSSNAATTLLGIDRLFNLRLCQKDLYQLGARLGSDVNFFLAQSPFAFIRARGQIVEPFYAKALRHYIIWPGIAIATKEVYQRYRDRLIQLTKFLNNAKILRFALKKGDGFLIAKSIFNALENCVLSFCSELKEIKLFLERRGIIARVTGSGSALYTVGATVPEKTLRRFLPRRYSLFKVQRV